MLEWRNEQDAYERGEDNGNTSENCLWEEKPEAESNTGGIEPHHATNGKDAWMIFF